MNADRFPQHVAEEVVRVGAAEVFVLSLLAAVLRFPWLAIILAVDFGTRAFITPRWSFIAAASRHVFVPLFGFHGQPISYAPKRFAAAIGFSLSVLTLALAVAVESWAWMVPLLVLLIFSGLESFIGFCAGCKIYGLLMHWRIVPEHHCPECKLQ